MTQNDIYTKFMIEYDKANVTSSYPSLTKYEIAVILNKAYLALIAQKVTGNNPRQAPFEADTKAISDIQPLISTVHKDNSGVGFPSRNSVMYMLPEDFLYYISSMMRVSGKMVPVKLISHEIAQNFQESISNRPWIKNAVAYIENNILIVLYDNYEHDDPDNRVDESLGRIDRIPEMIGITYVKKPILFTQSFSGSFELNDTMAEELISLAVLMALENVESQRLQSKAQMRGLEA